VADIEAFPELLPQAWDATPLRIISFIEMIGLTKRRPPKEIIEDAVCLIRTLRHRRCRAGLSPHAPYSTLPELLRRTTGVAHRKRLAVCIHVAESAQEFEMFNRAKGEMY